MKRKVATQGGTGGMSAKINYAVGVGSGSRPGGGRMKTMSSAPAAQQMIRPKNKVGS